LSITKYQPQMGPSQSVLLTKSPANDHPSQKALDKQNRSIIRILYRQSDFFRKSGFCSNPYKFYLYFKVVCIVHNVKYYSMSKVVHSSSSAKLILLIPTLQIKVPDPLDPYLIDFPDLGVWILYSELRIPIPFYQILK
jgi:hypothetical protein